MEKSRIAAKQPAVLSLDQEPTTGVNVDARGTSRSVTGPTKEPGSSRSSFQ